MENNNLYTMTELKSEEKLKFRTKLSFGVGEFGQQFVQLMLSYFLIFYLTTYAGISPVAAGTMILVTRIWDAINDPMMGIIIDNTNSRWGKARPYLLFCSIPLAVFFVMCFAVPELSPTLKLVYIYIAYIGLGMLYTATGISYNTLIPRMTDDPLERLSLVTYKGFIAYIPIIAVPAVTAFIVSRFGTESNPGRGYTASAIIFGILIVVCYFITFFNVKEKINSEEKNKLPVIEGLKAIGKNIHLIKIFTCNLIYWTLSGVINGTIVFYVFYYLKRQDLQGILIPLGVAPIIISMLLTKKVAAKIGKRKTLLIGVTITIIGFLIRFITKDASLSVYVISILMIGFGIGFYIILVIPMAIDTIEYGEWKYGIRGESLVLSALTFTNKLGIGLAGVIIGFFLDKAGYVPKAATQSETVLKSLFTLSVVIPLISAIVIFIIIYTYKLDDQMPKIMKDLTLRKKQNRQRGDSFI